MLGNCELSGTGFDTSYHGFFCTFMCRLSSTGFRARMLAGLSGHGFAPQCRAPHH